MSHHAHDHHGHDHHHHPHDRAAAGKPWRVHPRWLIVVGFVLMALVVLTWTLLL